MKKLIIPMVLALAGCEMTGEEIGAKIGSGLHGGAMGYHQAQNTPYYQNLVKQKAQREAMALKLLDRGYTIESVNKYIESGVLTDLVKG